MEGNQLSDQTLALILKYQKTEETDHLIYSRMAAREKNDRNKKILSQIADDEKDHAAIWRRYTGRQVQPNRLKVLWYHLMSLLFGYTFVIKLMEKNEYTADKAYQDLVAEIPETSKIIEDEQTHEERLTEMLDMGMHLTPLFSNANVLRYGRRLPEDPNGI